MNNDRMTNDSLLINISRNILSTERIEYYLNMAVKPTPDQLIPVAGGNYGWENRTVEITNDPIVAKIMKYIQDNYNLKLICKQAQIQTWVTESYSDYHIHDHAGREDITINIIIYLNDNFDGGHFIMENLDLKPNPGLMVCFDGSKIKHGVTKVTKGTRYDIIFWCIKK